eukprot:TRINITY_DN47901_c0_g1_i1.p1 TRINITY_DN47901_c0_g1~~TRINITY_DN47901_c0_g1_i1.p1  ORF type:complete len:114 (+),score=13.03 TRINITY_DN47901_c0_g1_i1:297-638(+)
MSKAVMFDVTLFNLFSMRYMLNKCNTVQQTVSNKASNATRLSFSFTPVFVEQCIAWNVITVTKSIEFSFTPAQQVIAFNTFSEFRVSIFLLHKTTYIQCSDFDSILLTNIPVP